MTDDDSLEPSRLRNDGTDLEQSVLDSATEDQPTRAARQAVFSFVLADHRARQQRGLTVGIALSAVAAAAGVALFVYRPAPPPVTLAAEPQVSASSKASPSARPPPPSPSGASAFEPCTPLTVAEGKNPLIDDFEDGDERAPRLEHRTGVWELFNDGTGTQSPKPGMVSPVRIPGGRGASHFALHSAGGKFSKWGSSLSLEFNPRHCYDASAYGGIEFWARGRGEVRVVLKMTQVMAEEFGGSCTHDCYDGHAKRIKLTRDFQHVVVRWEDLKQQGFGAPPRFDARSLDAVDFSVLAEETPFDYWIDDVSFIPR